MSKKKSVSANSEVSRRVSALRKALRLSQEEFAAKVGVGRIAALYWENGRSQPSGDAYVQLAKLAQDVDLPTAVWFWQQVGVDRDALQYLVPEFEKSAKEAEQRARDAAEQTANDILTVPILRDIGSISSPALATSEHIEGWFPLPSVLVPNSAKTSCVRAPEDFSALYGEDLVVVDATEVSLDQLWGRMVVAERQSSGKVYVGYLQKLEMENNRFVQALSITRLNEGANLNSVKSFGDAIGAKPKRSRAKEKCAGPFLLSPGLLLPMTPPADWRILGHAIGWMSYAQIDAISLLTKAT